ncbi:MAG: N-acetylmuramoyl-L-alanine amidase [Acidimicrobiia bacterium]
MRRGGGGRWAPLVAGLALVATACSGGGGEGAGSADVGSGGGGDATVATGVPLITTTAPTTTIPPAGEGAFITPTGVVLPVVSREDGRFTVTTPCGRTATLGQGTHVPRVAVVLDPGHGGAEPGAVAASGLKESTVNLAVTRHTRDALEAAGVSVLMTRTADYHVNLEVRTQLAVTLGAQAFVSIHHNAEPDEAWPRPGSETYYQIASPDSKRLAGLIYEEVVRALSQYQISWVADRDAGAKYREGSRGDYYAVLRQPATIVSALVELAFISNPAEAELISRPDVQKVEGEAVARGIVRYLRGNDPGSGFTEPYPRPTPPGGGGGRVTCADPALT